jgi:hypothetical protein
VICGRWFVGDRGEEREGRRGEEREVKRVEGKRKEKGTKKT